MNWFFVALGGALGAVGRYAVSCIPIKTNFPLLTFVTNILGAVLIGLIVGLVSSGKDVSPNAVLFWKTGVCGGFTTFSTFSLETLELLDKGAYFLGMVYAVISVVCCVFGVWCGKKMALLIG